MTLAVTHRSTRQDKVKSLEHDPELQTMFEAKKTALIGGKQPKENMKNNEVTC